MKGEEEKDINNLYWTFLTSVRTEIEADIIMGLLEQESIPIKKSYPGIGNLKASYGIINGVEIYVPKDRISQANEILSTYGENENEFEDFPEE